MPRIANPKLLQPVRTAPRVMQPKIMGRGNVPDLLPKPWPEGIDRGKNYMCVRKGKSTLRACHIELIFLGKDRAPKLGVPPGAYLRACLKPKSPGKLIPVRDHIDAYEVSQRFCTCRTDGNTVESCAAAVGDMANTLGRTRGRTRKRR